MWPQSQKKNDLDDSTEVVINADKGLNLINVKTKSSTQQNSHRIDNQLIERELSPGKKDLFITGEFYPTSCAEPTPVAKATGNVIRSRQIEVQQEVT